jgi:hypothetical protein
MNQLNLELFFPLTEQTNLDLDFKPCLEYADAKRKNQIWYTGDFTLTNTGSVTTSVVTQPAMLTFKPDNNSVGCWRVGDYLEFYSNKEPSWLHKQMSKIFFGWKWKKTK